WKIVALLLAQKAKPRAEHLSKALAAGQGDVAEKMHRAGLKASGNDLIAAARSGDAASVAVALKCGADPNAAQGNDSARGGAAGRGHAARAKALLAAKIDPGNPHNARARPGAAEAGHTAIVKTLLEAGIKTTWHDTSERRTALMRAALNGRDETV